jgi:hypothetical protein
VKDEAAVTSRGGSLSDGGMFPGTVGGVDHFGITAEEIGAVTVGGTALPLPPGAATTT